MPWAGSEFARRPSSGVEQRFRTVDRKSYSEGPSSATGFLGSASGVWSPPDRTSSGIRWTVRGCGSRGTWRTTCWVRNRRSATALGLRSRRSSWPPTVRTARWRRGRRNCCGSTSATARSTAWHRRRGASAPHVSRVWGAESRSGCRLGGKGATLRPCLTQPRSVALRRPPHVAQRSPSGAARQAGGVHGDRSDGHRDGGCSLSFCSPCARLARTDDGCRQGILRCRQGEPIRVERGFASLQVVMSVHPLTVRPALVHLSRRAFLRCLLVAGLTGGGLLCLPGMGVVILSHSSFERGGDGPTSDSTSGGPDPCRVSELRPGTIRSSRRAAAGGFEQRAKQL